ncbi:MFS transporter [Planctomonas sp. JC2975]|uniref:MFS transporter n=1 Tax=Planctomonas sp. JC2975 TaxID=2729626 RepID=UPI0014730765|nr:MFS transporter [Planctomonas sp. JC2975]NNC12068.1 MFS transporter [Planctomonas sp. JC2975]
MTTTTLASAGVDRRLASLRIKPVNAVAIVAAMIVFVGDAQALALIPLTSTMEKEYGLSPSQASLVLAILGLVGAGFLPVLTRLAERISLRLFLLIGVALVAVGNAICALAPGFTLLLIGRGIIGFSAAMPIALALVREKADTEHSTNRALAVVTAAVGISVVFSFLLGGFILQIGGHVSTVFWVMAAVGLLTFLVGLVIVPDYRTTTRQRVDLLGAITLVVGLTLIAIGIGFAESWGGTGLLVLIGGFVVMILWVVVELNVKDPMIDLRRTFRRYTVPAFILGGLFGMVAVISNLAVTMYGEFNPEPFSKVPALAGPLGYGWGLIVLQTSLFLMPTAFFILIGGFTVGRIITKIGVKTTFAIASICTIVAFTLMALLHDQVWANAVGMGIWGIAYALGSTAANAAVLHAAKNTEGAHFSAASSTIVATIGSLAAPIFTAILYAFAITVPIPDGKGGTIPTQIPTVTSYENTYWTLVIFGVLMLVFTVLHKTQKFRNKTVEEPVAEVVADGVA